MALSSPWRSHMRSATTGVAIGGGVTLVFDGLARVDQDLGELFVAAALGGL